MRRIKVEPDKVGHHVAPAARWPALSDGHLPLGQNTLALELADGQLRVKPFVIETDEGRATGIASLDLRTLAFDSEWRLERKRATDRSTRRQRCRR